MGFGITIILFFVLIVATVTSTPKADVSLVKENKSPEISYEFTEQHDNEDEDSLPVGYIAEAPEDYPDEKHLEMTRSQILAEIPEERLDWSITRYLYHQLKTPEQEEQFIDKYLENYNGQDFQGMSFKEALAITFLQMQNNSNGDIYDYKLTTFNQWDIPNIKNQGLEDTGRFVVIQAEFFATYGSEVMTWYLDLDKEQIMAVADAEIYFLEVLDTT